jgi:hypothetical protein
VGVGRLVSVRLTPGSAVWARVSQRAGLQFNERGCYVAFFDDMLVALEAYPETYVTLEIIDVVAEDEGEVVNVRDEWTFKVKLTNNGPLNLTGVTVRIDGVNGATVKAEGAAAQFASEFVWDLTPRPTINGDGGELIVPVTSLPFHFKAPATPQDEKTLVKATLEHWDGDLSRIMINHSDPHRQVPKGTYSAAVEGL